jgi:hypothetical protein
MPVTPPNPAEVNSPDPAPLPAALANAAHNDSSPAAVIAPEVPAPMLDVHPPHHPTHTWRDFFIHIATIVVGLLIAVGLEQTVEAIHRHHERVQLIEDLRQEAEGRTRVIAANKKAFVILKDWLRDGLHSTLAATPSGGYVTFTLPPMSPTDGDLKPEAAVWAAAKSSGIVSVLSRQEIEAWDRVDYFAQLAQKDAEASQAALRSIQATADHLGVEFKPGATIRVTTGGRDELTRAMGVLIEAMESLDHQYQETVSASGVLLHDTH